MSSSLRVIDSGLRSARENLSVTEALCRGHLAGRTPDTLRFQHFVPSAIIGRHQILRREVNIDWVAAHGVGTARRMTGGGAIIMGPGIVGWELIIARHLVPQGLADVSATICEGVASGLRALGCDAQFRPRNDVEIAGRKVCGTGGYFDGGCLVFQGTVMLELDPALLTGALNLPAHKLGKRGLESLLDRVGDLRRVLGVAPGIESVREALAEGIGRALGLSPEAGALTGAEEELARQIFADEIGTDAFVAGVDQAEASVGRIVTVLHPTPGGMLEVAVNLRDGKADMVDSVLISGDFFVTPARIIADLEADLRHRPLAALAERAAAFLARGDARFLGLAAGDIEQALAQAAANAAEPE